MESTPTLHTWHDYVCPFCDVEPTGIMRIEEAGGIQPSAADRDHWVLLLRNGVTPTATGHA